MELRIDKKAAGCLKYTGSRRPFESRMKVELLIQREKDLHQHIFCGIGMIHTEIEAFPRIVHKLKLASAAKKSYAQLLQGLVKRQMPLDSVGDALLQQRIPDPFKFRRDQMLF